MVAAAKANGKGLVRYEAACRALAAAKAADEVMLIRDKADAMRAAARIAKNKQLEIDAAEIRIRAERRLGELLKAQKEAGLLAKGARENGTNRGTTRVSGKPASLTLAQVGIDKSLADRARKLAAVPKKEFEQELDDWRERVSEENKRVATKLEKRGESEIRRAERKECDIQDDVVVDAWFSCPKCGQRLPEGVRIDG